MSNIFDLGIVSPPETYDQAVELCGRVHHVEAADAVSIEQTQWGDQLLVVISKDSPHHPYHAFVTDRETLLQLARHILSTLDPVTNEQLREEIRKLLEDQN